MRLDLRSLLPALRVPSSQSEPVVVSQDMRQRPHLRATKSPRYCIQVTLLENVRFYKEETKNVPEFAEKMAANADMFVNDAFGAPPH